MLDFRKAAFRKSRSSDDKEIVLLLRVLIDSYRDSIKRAGNTMDILSLSRKVVVNRNIDWVVGDAWWMARSFILSFLCLIVTYWLIFAGS